MNIYLIRHTKVKVDSGTCYGQSDVALAEDKFIPACQHIQAQIPTSHATIISSPLQRCLQLAEKLNDNQPVMTDKRLMEIHFGDWEMQKWNNINQDLLQKWMNDYVNTAPPNGESFQAVFERCQDFWNDIIITMTKTCQTVIVVTHLGVIRALLALVLEIPLKKSLCLQANYGAVNKLKYHTDEKTNQTWITLEYLNQ